MNKVGIAAYGITPFTKDDKKIESILFDSAKNLLENNSIIEKNVSQDYFSLGWIDSLKFIQLISDIENNFKIVFLNDEFQKKSFTTVEGLTKIVEEKVNEKL